MLTNNLKSILLVGTAIGTLQLHKIDGTYIGVSSSYPSNWRTFSSAWVSQSWCSRLFIGNGNTSKVVGDYTLDKLILPANNYNIKSATATYSSDTNDCKMILTQQMEWLGETTEITEVGLFGGWGDNNCYIEAIERLSSPLTVSSGDTFTVSMTIG